MISYFQHLGERIERAWLEWSYDEEVFSLLAHEALGQDPPTENVEFADIIDWVFATSHTFRQPHLDHAKQLARSDLFHPLFLKSPLREA